MATIGGRMKQNRDENISLHDLFQIIGNQMTTRDIRVLKFLYTGILSDELKDKINDGYTFLLALEKIGKVDESNFKHLLHALRIITRHDLIQYVNLRKRKTGSLSILAVCQLRGLHGRNCENNSVISPCFRLILSVYPCGQTMAPCQCAWHAIILKILNGLSLKESY